MAKAHPPGTTQIGQADLRDRATIEDISIHKARSIPSLEILTI